MFYNYVKFEDDGFTQKRRAQTTVLQILRVTDGKTDGPTKEMGDSNSPQQIWLAGYKKKYGDIHAVEQTHI